jgi:hypothetical protein
MTAIYITVQLRRPSEDDPGAVAEGWYRCDGNVVQLTDRYGNPLAGDKNTRRPREGQTARECAVQLLRSKATTYRASKPFNLPLRYPR